jgi:hypothetical protein
LGFISGSAKAGVERHTTLMHATCNAI